MIRVLFLSLALLTGFFAQAQPKARKIKNFSVDMRISAGMTGTVYHYTIDKKGNGRYTRTVRDTLKSTIDFTLDKKQLADLQETIINKAGFYAIPDKVNCDHCADGIDLAITVSSSRGVKTVKGNNPQRVNDDVNHVYKLIKSLVTEKKD